MYKVGSLFKVEREIVGVVQRRFTRLIPQIGGLSNKKLLDRLCLCSPEFRRLRMDLI